MNSKYHRFLLLALLWACASPEPQEVSPGAQEVSPRAQEQDLHAVDARPVIRFGVISRYNPILMYRNYQPIMDYLSARTPYRFELKLGRTYRDAVRYLEEGETDIASLGGITYLMAHARFGARPLVKPLAPDGRPFYRSVFIVREESPLRSLADLRGHSLALGSGYSTSGNVIPRYELARAGVRLEDLERVENLPHHDLVAKAVLEGLFDAGAVKDVVAYQYRFKGLRFIHFSGPIPSVPLTIRPDLPDTIARAVVEALVSLEADDPLDRERMESWDPEFRYGFVVAKDADYESLRQKLDQIPGGCAQGCHEKRSF